MATEEGIEQPVAVWLRNPRTGTVNLVVHPETIRRCLSEGHVSVSDPRRPVVADVPPDESTPDPDAVAALQEAQMDALSERNNAAHAAFDVAPIAPADKSVKPVRRIAPRQPRGA